MRTERGAIRNAPLGLPGNRERGGDPEKRSDESAGESQSDGFDEHLQDEVAPPRADCHPDAEFARPFADRNEHDVHQADSPDGERH